MSDPIELVPDRWANGGEVVGRWQGKAVFIPDALPGELIRVRIVREKSSWARAELLEVLAPSPLRTAPPCPAFGTCGGCQWQHASYDVQLDAKRQIVRGQLEHLGGVDDPMVRETVAPGASFGYRNRMTFHVAGGRLSMYRRRSRDSVAIEQCHLLAPALADLFARLDPVEGVRQVTLRSGIRTGDLLVVVVGAVPPGAEGWGASVARSSRGRLRAILGEPFIHEEVADARFRISGEAFFQVNTDGAEALVRLVGEAVDPRSDDVLIDAYSGVGLFAATIGRGVRKVIAVESDARALGDLRHNLNGMQAQIVGHRFEAGVGGTWDIAIVDPPRIGLGRAGVDVVASGGPRAVAYVSCDPASLARDSRHFAERGYRLQWATPVDLFPQTFHIETVAAFVR
ncbi:MAG: class I SAM-dependent RNA methyltransferase [Actinobacteria bacterium]|nr:class I SAM-dependent RNA methyltransferase [Actinomycetota bacterium]